MTRALLIAVPAFLISIFITYAIILVSKKRGIALSPSDKRWNKRATPSFGGIAIYITFISLTSIFCVNLRTFIPVIIGGTAIFLLGFLDDILDLKPYQKLLIEIAIACCMILAGTHLTFSNNPLLFVPLTILWIVGITNAFNLLDNMDGLAPGIGVISSLFLLILSVRLGIKELYTPSLIMGSALAAFLIFNFNPAKIFLGDCGSLFIGFILAMLSIQGTWYHASNLFLILLTPILILGIPIFDTLFVSFQRKLHGLPITQGGKDHSSHRLVMLGWSEKRTALFLYGIATVLGIIAVIGIDYDIFITSTVVAITLIALVLFATFLAQTKVYGKKPRERSVYGNIGVILYKRRILDIIVDSILIMVAYILAYLIKYDALIDYFNMNLIGQSLPIIIVVKLGSLYVTGLYEGVWRYIDFDDSMRLLKGAALGSMASVIILVGFTRFEGYSRSLFMLDFIIFIFLLAGTRIVMRTFRESFWAYPKKGKKVLLIGAGEAGKMILGEIRKNRGLNLSPIGILDDDSTKHGKWLMGLPVLGATDRLSEVVSSKEIEKVIISIPSASNEEKEKIIEKCKEARVDYSVMRGFDELF